MTFKTTAEIKKPIYVWLHKRTGQLWEYMPTSLGGYAIASVEIETAEFTGWHDWAERKIFLFDDEEYCNPKNFIDLGEL